MVSRIDDQLVKNLPPDPADVVRLICSEFDEFLTTVPQSKSERFPDHPVYADSDDPEIMSHYFDFFHALAAVKQQFNLHYVYVGPIAYTIDPNDYHCLEFIRRTFSRTKSALEEVQRPIAERAARDQLFRDSQRRIARLFHRNLQLADAVQRIREHSPHDAGLQDYSQSFFEAWEILRISPTASATLSRRNLQRILREKAEAKGGDLAKEIEDVIERKLFPPYIARAIDAVRHIGNYAAHPSKSTTTGLIVAVEPWEAEWSLTVIADLLDFYFIEPLVLEQKRQEVETRLAEIGKNPKLR